jgi:hypothetical protein
MLKDMYVVSTLSFAPIKRDTLIAEKLGELQHCMHTAMYKSAEADKNHYKMISRFNALCFKHFKKDFSNISVQMIGSLSLQENLREILSQLELQELHSFFTALKLNLPAIPKAFESKE